VISRIDILGVAYKVKSAAPGSMGRNVNGVCDDSSATISVDREVAPPVARRILLHEVAHAISDALDLRLTEAQVVGLSVGLNSIPQLKIV